MTRLISRLFPFAEREQHPAPRRQHSRRSVQSDRERLIALFVD